MRCLDSDEEACKESDEYVRGFNDGIEEGWAQLADSLVVTQASDARTDEKFVQKHAKLVEALAGHSAELSDVKMWEVMMLFKAAGVETPDEYYKRRLCK